MCHTVSNDGVMKSLGFLFALATVVAVISAQSQSHAAVQVGTETWSGAPNQATKMILLPAGYTINHQAAPGSRPILSKQVQVAPGARPAKHHKQPPRQRHGGNYVGQVQAHAQPALQAQSKPHRPHKVPRHGSPQPTQPASSAPATAVAAATSQATAVAKTPQQTPSDIDSPKKTPQPLKLPDLSALGIPNLLKDLPQDFAKIIQSGINDSSIAKAASDSVTAFITAHSTSIPLVIAGIQKGLTDAANVISPDNVTKAVAILSDKSQDIVKAFVEKLAELAVSEANKIGAVIKNFAAAGQFAQAVAIGLSVVTTLGLILQNEVFSKIPLDFSHLPIPLDKLPIPLDKWKIPLDKLPIQLDKLPIPLHKLPIPFDKLLFSLDKLPKPLDKPLIPVGDQPSPASPSQPVSQTSSAGQAVPGASKAVVAPAVAVAQPIAAEYVSEEMEEEYDEEEEAYQAIKAIASVGPGPAVSAVAQAG